MNSGGRCAECGSVIPADSLGGFCAQCLLRLGLEQAPESTDAKTEAHANNILAAASSSLETADRIGRYRLLRELGHGGCGVVYLAEQEAPVRRKVALKVIKLGMDTREVVTRFEAERQALALMDHPNIAKVLDAGAVGASAESQIANRKSQIHYGRPYFVMELVDGPKITDYCDQHQLSTQQRLELFVQVCHAVQHAHQKGIIHRDLKPSNVLVATHDGPAAAGCPKVIDFGIAKATQGRLTDETFFTAFEQFLGTPAYMSPEQADLGGLDIDTRSDIYSLGVLLYELLAGKTPFDSKQLMAAGLEAMRRTIRETEPPKPSTRLSTLAALEQTTIAKRRQADARRLIDLTRGDLDWIVMKCLEKDRTRRYETANSLASDLERHLRHEPVLAGPPSRAYRLQKWIRRNQVMFGVAAAIFMALLLGVAVSTTQAIRATVAEHEQSRLRQQAETAQVNEARERAQAQTEAAKSKQVAQFLQDMLRGVGPAKALGRDTTMLREILDKIAARVGKELTNQPEVEIELRHILEETYSDLGLYKEAEAMARENLRLARIIFGKENLNFAHFLQNYGEIQLHLGDYKQAEQFIRDALAIYRRLLGREHPQMVSPLNSLGVVLRMQQRLAEAEKIHREAVEIRRKHLGNDHPELARLLGNLAFVLRMQGRLAEAGAVSRQALDMVRKLHGPDHPNIATALESLGLILAEEGNYEEQAAAHREALAMRRKLLGNDHPQVASSLVNLAAALQNAGQFEKAESLVREALEVQRKRLSADHPDVSSTRNVLGELLRLQRKMAEAETVHREVLHLRRTKLGDNHPDVAVSLMNLALVFREQSRLAEAENLQRESLAIQRTHWGNEHPEVAGAIMNLAVVLKEQGRLTEAEHGFRDALGILMKALPNDHLKVGKLISHLALVLGQQGRLAEAETAHREALEIHRKLPNRSGTSLDLARSLRNLASALKVQHKDAEAESLLREELAIQRKRARDPDLIDSLNSLAKVLKTQRKLGEAENIHREALAIQRKSLGNAHPDLSYTLNNLAYILGEEGKLYESETLYREALAINLEAFGYEHQHVAVVLQNLAKTLQLQGQLTEAEALSREAVALGRKLLGNEHPQFRSAFSGLKSCLEEQNKYDEVADLWREQIDLMRSEVPDDDPRLAEVLDRLVLALLEQRKFIQAEFPARECLAIRQKKLPDDPLTFRMHGLLGLSLFGQRKYREAEPLLLSGYQGMRDREARLSSQGKRNLKTALQYLVQFYEATDQTAQAKEWRKKLEETERNLTEKLPPPSPVADNGSASNRE